MTSDIEQSPQLLPIKFHPLCEMFPIMSDQELASLAEDIKEHGQREPIVTTPSGAILDGRNRYLACQKLGLQPRTVTTTLPESGWPAFVVSANIERRHLTSGQYAALAAKLATRRRGGAQTANSQNGITLKEACAITGASVRSAASVRRAEKKSPRLAAAIASGDLRPGTAELITRLTAVGTAAAMKLFEEGDITGAKKRAQAERQASRQLKVDQAGETKDDLPRDRYRILFSELKNLPNLLRQHPITEKGRSELLDALRKAELALSENDGGGS